MVLREVFTDSATARSILRYRFFPHCPREVVKEGLEGALPINAHEIINNREGAVTVGITQLFPRPKGVFVSEFESRDDLIEVLLGSW